MPDVDWKEFDEIYDRLKQNNPGAFIVTADVALEPSMPESIQEFVHANPTSAICQAIFGFSSIVATCDLENPVMPQQLEKTLLLQLLSHCGLLPLLPEADAPAESQH